MDDVDAGAAAGLQLAIADSPDQVREQRVEFQDSLGRQNEIVLTRRGHRLLSARHYVNGELFISVDKQWRRNDSLWVLDAVHGTVAAHGQTVGVETQIEQEIKRRSAFATGADALVVMALTGVGWFSPQPAYAAVDACWDEIIRLAGSSASLAYAIYSKDVGGIISGFFGYISAINNLLAACE